MDELPWLWSLPQPTLILREAMTRWFLRSTAASWRFLFERAASDD